MTQRTTVETLEPRRHMAIDVTVAQTDLAGDANLMVQSIAGARGGGSTVGNTTYAPRTTIVYSDRDNGTSLGADVYRRDLADGAASTAPALVNVTIADAQMNPDVAVAPNDGSTLPIDVVVWQSRNQDGDGWGVYARAYSAATPSGTAEILLSQTTAGDQIAPSVAMDSGGRFVVAWQSGDAIYARRFNALGSPLGNEFVVAAAPAEVYADPDVAMLADGRFAITWTRALASGDASTDVRFQTYAADGTAIGSAQTVNSVTAGNQAEPAIATAGSTFVVAWSDASAGEATIFFRVYTPAGTAANAATQVSQDSDGVRSRPQVAGDFAGNFTVGWTRQEGGAFYSTVDFRSYDATLSATSNETPIGDGSSARSLFGLVQTGTGTFRDVSTIGEFLGYGVPVGATLANVISLDGTGAADSIVAYDLNATTVRAGANGARLDYLRSAYAYLRGALGDGHDAFDASGTTMPVTVDGGAGDDTIRTGDGRDNVNAGDGNDYVVAGGENDYVSGGSGDDSLFAGDGSDTLTGGAGRNRLYGGNGNDRLNGSNGRDFLYGEADSDRLYGNGGNDYVDGGGGSDRAYGGDGDDSLIGGSSIDRLYGENGNDSFIGGPGNDYLFGGPGTDTTRVPDAGDLLDSIEASG